MRETEARSAPDRSMDYTLITNLVPKLLFLDFGT
jgi:hypothetical protein